MVLSISLTVGSCPWTGSCYYDGTNMNATVEDLIVFSPFQNVYTKGDVVICKVSIPSTNTYFFGGKKIDLFEQTNDYNGRLIIDPLLFIDNEITYIKGSSEAHNGGWSNVEYNPTDNVYELEIQIKFLRTGFYSIDVAFMIDFRGNCNTYGINTNIQGWNKAKIEFEVKELEE